MSAGAEGGGATDGTEALLKPARSKQGRLGIYVLALILGAIAIGFAPLFVALLRLVWARVLTRLVHAETCVPAVSLNGEAGRWVSLPATR